jgi:hypothetical protein
MAQHLSKAELVGVLRETIAIAKARRDQYQAQPLPLRGDVPAGESGDVIAMLRSGQLVAVSATFVQEIINHLGDRRDERPLPTRLIQAGAAV